MNTIQVHTPSRASKVNVTDMIPRGNQTYNLAEVFSQNLHSPERKEPESNLEKIKRSIVDFYWKYDIELNERECNISYQVSAIAFGFPTNYNMHSSAGSKAQQAAGYELTEAFGRNVETSGTQNRVVIYVSR